MSQRFRPIIYAIDFGTSNSLLGASDGQTSYGPVALDAKAPDPTVLRTLLYFPDAEHCFVGSEAIAEYVANELEGRLLRSVKRFLPRKEFVGTFVGDRPLNLEHLVGAFLGEMRRRANRFFDTDVRRVVLGRPARFDRDDSRDRYAEYRLERSARLAGFTEVHFCPEPVAAAREFLGELSEPKTILVADIRPEDQVRIDKLLCLINDQLGFSVFEAIEATKHRLSYHEEAAFVFDHPAMQIGDVITRAEFEQYTARTVETILQTMDATVADTGIGYGSIDLVCCTGGTSQVPALEQAVRQRVGADRVRHFKRFHSVISGLTDRAKAIAS